MAVIHKYDKIIEFNDRDIQFMLLDWLYHAEKDKEKKPRIRISSNLLFVG